ncbi:hypothetical protein GCM10010124_19620 [Pilimelia terevasa]|uniref:Uncharacterized protein n=1 Tax=Pilimelia terevasa TaxID=53372 RepID=A0A8J3BQ45_9ACTN|nr:hypothetical protein GCM10010124_19620 [Pilimelia terevasa]
MRVGSRRTGIASNVEAPDYLAESAARGRFAVHSVVMSLGGSGARFAPRVRHDRVSSHAASCAGRHELGPNANVAEAERAPRRVRNRSAAVSTADARWAGEDD